MFGSASVTSNTARDGNAYFWEFKPALAQLVTLGLYTPRWMRDKYIKHPALGMIEHGSFEPEGVEAELSQSCFSEPAAGR